MNTNNFDISLLPNYIINSNSFYAIVTDLQGNYVYVNNRFLEKFNFITSNFIGQSITNTIHPDDADKCALTVIKCLEEPHKTHSIEIRKPQNKNNEYLYSYWEFSSFFNKNGDIIGVLCIGNDLSKEKSLNNLLLETQSKLNSLFNSTNEGFIFLNPQFNIEYFNKSLEENYSKLFFNNELKIGESILSYYEDEEKKNDLIAMYQRVLNGEQIELLEEYNHNWFQITIFKVVTEDGKAIGLAYNIINVTQNKQDQNRILEQNKKLKEIAWQQSHEVRSPVVNLLGITEQLNDNENLTKQDQEMLFNAITSEIKRLDVIIKSIIEKTNSIN